MTDSTGKDFPQPPQEQGVQHEIQEAFARSMAKDSEVLHFFPKKLFSISEDPGKEKKNIHRVYWRSHGLGSGFASRDYAIVKKDGGDPIFIKRTGEWDNQELYLDPKLTFGFSTVGTERVTLEYDDANRLEEVDFSKDLIKGEQGKVSLEEITSEPLIRSMGNMTVRIERVPEQNFLMCHIENGEGINSGFLLPLSIDRERIIATLFPQDSELRQDPVAAPPEADTWRFVDLRKVIGVKSDIPQKFRRS